MPWIHENPTIVGELEISTETSAPLLMVTPLWDVYVSDLTGTLLMRISSRPFFVPLTQQEVSQVMDDPRMVDVIVQRPSSEPDPPASTNTDLHAWLSDLGS